MVFWIWEWDLALMRIVILQIPQYGRQIYTPSCFITTKYSEDFEFFFIYESLFVMYLIAETLQKCMIRIRNLIRKNEIPKIPCIYVKFPWNSYLDVADRDFKFTKKKGPRYFIDDTSWLLEKSSSGIFLLNVIES